MTVVSVSKVRSHVVQSRFWIGTTVVSVILVLWSPWAIWNFGIVEPGLVFRSAQPEEGFERLIRERKLASVLNLRAGSNADWWYEQECRLTDDAGVDLYDYPMSATARPSRRQILTLIDLFRRCRYPLLIHCKSGSDRTGLASALYRLSVQGVRPEEAEQELSLRYGHIRAWSAWTLHEPLTEYASWLRGNGVVHTPERFRLWVERDYRDPDPSTAFRPLTPGPRPQLAGVRGGRQANAGSGTSESIVSTIREATSHSSGR
jgi:hypothetical protein